MSDRRITLRPATAEDVPALVSLMDAVLGWLVERGRTEQWGTVPFSRIPGFPERVADWTSQGVITLAERDHACVGLLAAAPMVPPRIPAGLVTEGAMFVHTVMSDRGPGGRGVGSALMEEAERRARAYGAPALALDHWAGSAELARVYDGFGYVLAGECEDEQEDGRKVRNAVRVRRLDPQSGGSVPRSS
ncbi:GNAT family N-acetyltransferase [Nonomuraea basaltis]|uniref:GNAT family N-acetyltransferase n=1 Tax=Nonomuraea basaltis TaxID=2495887 RepID=UPI00110C404E|nr:GNAT family N-acetyltransferase [Nonomuraea basaltis]TMR96493.1 GNAT family N-acetyltransferase [Nonomuraea basaltis]